jgi:hypothetical protein
VIEASSFRGTELSRCPHHFIRGRNHIQFPKHYFRNVRRWTKSKNAVLPSMRSVVSSMQNVTFKKMFNAESSAYKSDKMT